MMRHYYVRHECLRTPCVDREPHRDKLAYGTVRFCPSAIDVHINEWARDAGCGLACYHPNLEKQEGEGALPRRLEGGCSSEQQCSLTNQLCIDGVVVVVVVVVCVVVRVVVVRVMKKRIIYEKTRQRMADLLHEKSMLSNFSRMTFPTSKNLSLGTIRRESNSRSIDRAAGAKKVGKAKRSVNAATESTSERLQRLNQEEARLRNQLSSLAALSIGHR